MRRSETKSIGDFLRDFVNENDFGSRLKEMATIAFCREMLGPVMINYVKDIRISGGVLYIRISSSVVKTELIMHREEIRKRLNDNAGTDLIQRIVFY